MQQAYFYSLADFLTSQLTGSEIFTAYLIAEQSDFVRINHAQIRQPGSVTQGTLSVRLIDQSKQASISISLVGEGDADKAQLQKVLADLRAMMPLLPVDPHLLINTTVQSTEHIEKNDLCATNEMVEDILSQAKGLDCVGILASGSIVHGFANSFGQRNWFVSHNFNWDWSLVHSADKAVTASYAGKSWDSNIFAQKMVDAKQQLSLLSRPSKTLTPGEYRAYLSPVAIWEILELISWGGFGIASHENKTTPLLNMIEGSKKLSPLFSLSEDVVGGVAPGFQSDGFIRPNNVPLITDGELTGALVSPRSAKEFQKETTGAGGGESPDALLVSGGTLKQEDILKELDTGVLIGNLWYLNYSDRAGGRMTGMTRFATFWVENGEIVQPVNVMRFDDTIYNILGENLEALTQNVDFLLSASSYFHRSTSSARLPGALLKSFCFTL